MVFVLSKHKKPLNMCTNSKARVLLKKGYALVHKIYPFTIRLKIELEFINLKDCKIKIDPGSKVTGIAILENNTEVVFLAELEHRGDKIVANLITRSGARRNRRQRETRYRRCKFVNHYLKKDSKYQATTPRDKGWLPPSVKSIESNIINLVKKLTKICNITSISVESVKFDTQLMDNPNISSVEYQQGTLLGYEVREYLLEKYAHTCQYCGGESKDKILEIEHMISKYNGGSKSIKNLNLSCHTCNNEKGSLNLPQWLDTLKQSKIKLLNKARITRIEKILATGKPLINKRYAAWVNSYRWTLVNDLRTLTNNLELATGGKTKFNRITYKISKEHYYDALCVGEVPEMFKFKTNNVLSIKSCGRGSHFRGRTNACGIIIKNLPRQKTYFGFQTGDIVKAVVSKGKKIGTYTGRVACRTSGYFNIQGKDAVVQGISHKYCKLIQRNDGYSYFFKQKTALI